MKIIIAPARNMKADPDSLPIQGLPQFLPQTETILDYLRSLSYDQLHHLWWDCSEKNCHSQLSMGAADGSLSSADPGIAGIYRPAVPADGSGSF